MSQRRITYGLSRKSCHPVAELILTEKKKSSQRFNLRGRVSIKTSLKIWRVNRFSCWYLEGQSWKSLYLFYWVYRLFPLLCNRKCAVAAMRRFFRNIGVRYKNNLFYPDWYIFPKKIIFFLSFQNKSTILYCPLN